MREVLSRPFNPARFMKRLARSERGTQLVELAIVLPVVLMLLGAAAEFGRFFYTYQTLSKATRAGARYLMTESAAGTSDDKAKSLVVYGTETGTGTPVVSGLTNANVQVVRTGGSSAFPDRVTVRIQGFTYQPLFDLGKLIGKPSLSLRVPVSPSTTMRYFSSIPS
ncbi:MAG: pilus assembly protein [Acidobacteria bacterium]|nr:pilus assembly protein [Acidobacteriota bacterium]